MNINKLLIDIKIFFLLISIPIILNVFHFQKNIISISYLLILMYFFAGGYKLFIQSDKWEKRVLISRKIFFIIILLDLILCTYFYLTTGNFII